MQDISIVFAPFFCFYISFAVLALLNVITGVFVESSLKSAKKDNDLFMIGNVREAFKNAVSDDDRGSKVMTWEKFESQLDQQTMQAYFKAIDVDPSEARGLFRLIDIDDAGAVDFEEFLTGCLRLRGPAKALDLQLLMHDVRLLAVQLKALAGVYQRASIGHMATEPSFISKDCVETAVAQFADPSDRETKDDIELPGQPLT
jgi:hypothetical protein